MYNHLLLSTVCECFSEVSFFFTPLYLFLSLSLSFALSLIHSLSFIFRSRPGSARCCHVIHVFPATSLVSRVSRSPKYMFFYNSPPFLTPRILLIVLLSVRIHVCVCVYACVFVTSDSVSQPDIIVTNPVMDVH